MRIAMLLFIPLLLIACGGQIAQMQKSLDEAAIRAEQQKVEHQAQLEALNATAVTALEKAEQQSRDLLAELEAQPKPVPPKHQPVPKPRVITKTVTHVKPIYEKDGNLGLREETALERRLEEAQRRSLAAQKRIRQVQQSLREAQEAIAQMRDVSSLERHGPGGVIGSLLTLAIVLFWRYVRPTTKE